MFKGFKTIVYGAALILGSALANPEVVEWVTEHFAITGGAIGTGVIILRAITSSPIFRKE